MVPRHVTCEAVCSHTVHAPDKPHLYIHPRLSLSPPKPLSTPPGAARVLSPCGAGFLVRKRTSFLYTGVWGALLISILANSKNQA